MKFVKITTKHTREEIDQITSEFDKAYVRYLMDFYDKFKYVEYYTPEGFVCMYASICQRHLDHLLSQYSKASIGFQFEDVTQTILFGNVPEIMGEQETNNLKALIQDFLNVNLTTDVVLDKISHIGIESLSELDKKVLTEH